MEALHENVEWTEVIEVLTPFFGGSIERKITSPIVRLLMNSHSFSSRTLWKLYTRMWSGQR
jgi:hypothetical protein